MDNVNYFVNFFASMYEWFGLNPLYHKDLGDELRGYNIACDGNYFETIWYLYVGWGMIGITLLGYAIQYHMIDSSRFKSKQHWWVMAVIIGFLNFLVGFLVSYNSFQAEDYCLELQINTFDCIGFGISNAIWGFLLFLAITSFKYPKYFSNNCRFTTFWKP